MGLTELYICVGLFLGICGSQQTVRFDSEEKCYKALEEVRKSSGVKIAYCRQPQGKRNEQDSGDKGTFRGPGKTKGDLLLHT